MTIRFLALSAAALGLLAGCSDDGAGNNQNDNPVCGNGQREGTEECDGADLGAATCASETGHDGGSLACTASCTIDRSGCYTCGDGAIDGPEVCDGSALDAETCPSQTGLTSGALRCDSSCLAFDTDPCFECGNGLKEPAEECDGDDFGAATCATETSYPHGSLPAPCSAPSRRRGATNAATGPSKGRRSATATRSAG